MNDINEMATFLGRMKEFLIVNNINAKVDWKKVQNNISYFNQKNTNGVFKSIDFKLDTNQDVLNVWIVVKCNYYQNHFFDTLENFACILSKFILNKGWLQLKVFLSLNRGFVYELMITHNKFCVLPYINSITDINKNFLIDCNNKNKQKRILDKEEIKDILINPNKEKYFLNVSISNIDFSDPYFNDINFTKIIFVHSELKNIKIHNKDFSNSFFYLTKVDNLDVENVNFTKTSFRGSNIIFKNFNNIITNQVEYQETYFEFPESDLDFRLNNYLKVLRRFNDR